MKNHPADKNGRQQTGQVAQQPCDQSVPCFSDADGAKIYCKHEESGISASLHGRRHAPQKRIGSKGIHHLHGDGQSTVAGEGTHQAQGKHLGGDAAKAQNRG